MPLQGTFDVLDFTEVLRLLGRRAVTGRLHLRSRSVTANLFFEEGALVGADQSEHQAAAATGDVRSRLEEVCFELLEADRGTFEFQPGKATTLPGAVRLKVDTVLTRARKRLDEWRVLSERVPSLDVHPRIVTDIDASEVTLDKARWRMLTAIDGRRNLRAIGRTLNLSDFDACRLLVDLLDAGVADLDEAAKAAAGNRDLVPTIPLPEGMAETAARPGDDHDGESVTVTRGARAGSTERSRPSDDAKRAATKPTTVGGSGGRPGPVTPVAARVPGPATEVGGGSAPAGTGPGSGSSDATTGDPTPTPVAPAPAPAAGGATTPATADDATRRRARRRTPGGSGANTPSAPSEGRDAAPAEAEAQEPTPASWEAEGRRPRRVVRIRSRAEPRPR